MLHQWPLRPWQLNLRQLACGCCPSCPSRHLLSQIPFLVFISPYSLDVCWSPGETSHLSAPQFLVRGEFPVDIYSTRKMTYFEWSAGFSVIPSIGWAGSLSVGLCHLMTVSVPSLPGFLLVNTLRMLLEPRRCRRPGMGTKNKTGERKGKRRPSPFSPSHQKISYQEKPLWNRGRETCPEVSPHSTDFAPTRMFVALKFSWPALIFPTPHALPSCLALLK